MQTQRRPLPSPSPAAAAVVLARRLNTGLVCMVSERALNIFQWSCFSSAVVHEGTRPHLQHRRGRKHGRVGGTAQWRASGMARGEGMRPHLQYRSLMGSVHMAGGDGSSRAGGERVRAVGHARYMLHRYRMYRHVQPPMETCRGCGVKMRHSEVTLGVATRPPITCAHSLHGLQLSPLATSPQPPITSTHTHCMGCSSAPSPPPLSRMTGVHCPGLMLLRGRYPGWPGSAQRSRGMPVTWARRSGPRENRDRPHIVACLG